MQLGFTKGVFLILTVCTIVFSLLLPFPSTVFGASEQQKLDNIQKEINKNRSKSADNEKTQSDLEKEIEAADKALSVVQEKIDNLQSEIDEVSAKMRIVRGELSDLRDQLIKKQDELNQALSELRRLNKQLGDRAEEYYKNNEVSYIEVLLSAESFLDFLNKADFLARIVNQDTKLLKEIKNVKADVEASKKDIEMNEEDTLEREAALQTEIDRISALQKEEKKERNSLSTLMSDKKAILATIGDEQAQIEAKLVAYARDAAELERIINASPSRGGGTFIGTPSASGFQWPVSGALTSYFGQRWGRMHEGIDIGVPIGTPVVASKAGVVSISSYYGGYGYLIDIDHGGGVHTRYGHNSRLIASEGQAVSRGQEIAKAGSSGRSTGPHVHFEIRFNGAAYDPLNYLP